MCARQNRETSRAQASWPCCWAEAADAIRTKGMTKRNRVILLCLTLINERHTGVLECPNWRRNAFVAKQRRAQMAVPSAAPLAFVARERLPRIAASVSGT